LTHTPGVDDGDVVSEPRTVEDRLFVCVSKKDVLIYRGINSGRDAGELALANTGVPGSDTDGSLRSWLCVRE
jgi:hypothetical protein